MNKASGGEGIPAELFQILKDEAVKVLHSICQYLENSAVATGLKKVSFHSNPKEGQTKNVQTPAQLHSFHILAKYAQNSLRQVSTTVREP